MNRSSLTALQALLAVLVLVGPVAAQTARPTERLTRVIDDAITVVRPGNRHPLARPDFDAGIAPAGTPMERMMLALEPNAAQQQALVALLEAQQDPQSPVYRQWLMPESFGQRFGAAERDVERVTAWLISHGFQVEPTPASRLQIIFSGTAAQVQSAFHTEMHFYHVNGRRHYANAADPQIPEALAEVVSGVVSLHDFHSEPMHRGLVPAESPTPEFTSGGSHYLAPADFAIIYDAAGLYSQSIDGSGQTIAVAGRSNLKLADVQAFRSQFGLPAGNPTVVLNGPDPGVLSSGEQSEATLDVEWAGAVAKKASIQFVVSASTNSSDGVALSSQYIVNHNLAPVLTLSFGLCEPALGASGNKFWNTLWQQAAAQGITVLVSSGDSGAAGCDLPSTNTATAGAAVNGLCSSPYSTCVGGTQFADASNPNAYWSASSTASTGASALSYIPEAAWNSSGAVAGGSALWAGGGGSSQVYTKPSWQIGPGVPADGHRDVPDVSLTSASHDGYLIAMNGGLYLIAGTSAATPALAGVMALAVQKTAGRVGNANPAFYALAAKQANGGAPVFHDVTAGSNSVPGVTGFTAGAGYDLATGLGSVDASLLVNHWSDVTVPTPAFQLSQSTPSLSLTQGTSGTVTLSLAVSGGFNAAVALSAATLPAGLTASLSPAAFIAPGSGAATLRLTAGASMAPGAYNVAITANGAGLSQSGIVAVSVLQNCSYSISPTSASVAAGAASYSFNVSTQTGCGWTAATTTGWITFAGGSSGSGSGRVSYSVALNNATASRIGSISVAGLASTVTQAGASAVFSLNPAAASFPASGGSGSVSIATSPSSASWIATSNASWISITSASSGAGPKTLTYSVSANTSSAARSGALIIAGLTFTITQPAPANCSYQVSLSAITYTAQGYVGSVSVAAASGCQWTASSNATWFTIKSGASGTGSGIVSYLAAPNTTSARRSALLSVAGYAITFTESPAAARSSAKLRIVSGF